jgi:hypothetical protein
MKAEELKARQDRLQTTLGDFAHENKDLLIIIADPHTDFLFAGYNDKLIFTQIKNNQGKSIKVVRDLIKHTKFNTRIDQFIGSIVELLHLPLKYGNHFFQFIDGALYNLQTRFAIMKSKGSKPIQKDNA